MNKYNVFVYLDRNEENNIITTPFPTPILAIEADNFKYAAAAALKMMGITEYSIDHLLYITEKISGWQKDVTIAVQCLNKDDLDEWAYFYLWI